ncbi:F-box protein FBW2-like [Curcuma longa]|uniref:F-box protein FBW2-like n=1 Tax=Curcuma longa TaxID=136217 RepID=UPI003D9F39BC
MQKQRLLGGGNGGGDSKWAELTPEVLASIFALIPTDELARTMSFVCRSWRDVLAEPYCWSVVSLEDWCRRVDRADVIDFVVRQLVRRSRGTIRRLSVYHLGDSGFAHAALFCRSLSVLEMAVSFVTDKMVKKHESLLSNLTLLDISHCANITAQGIEVLGKNCKALVDLRRNMPPPEITHGDALPSSLVDEGEAMAVANTMVGLRHLELSYGRFSDKGLVAILSNCTALGFLDIRGCWCVRLADDVESMCQRIETFFDPWVNHIFLEDDDSSEDVIEISSDEEDEA